MESSNNSAQQMEKKATAEEKKASNEAELPLETSPYLNYNDVEDYKRKGYGTEGHQDPVERNAAGSTDAPTLSGAYVPPASTAPTFTQP